ncbi:MAG: hypothetical protein AAGU14_00145 [Eubacteriaceae bacterium]
MNVNKLIDDTLSPLGYPVDYISYAGSADRYFTYNYADDRAELYADNEPINDVAYMQIHFFSPKTFNHMQVKKQVRKSLYNAGFSYPRISSFYEDDTGMNHLVFECEIEGISDIEED